MKHGPDAISVLDPRTPMIIDMMLDGSAYADICRHFKMNSATLRKLRKQPDFMDQYSRRKADREQALTHVAVEKAITAKDVLETAAVDAAQKMVSLSKGAESEKIQYSATQFILNQTIPKQKAKDDPTKGKILLDADAMRALVNVLRESMEFRRAKPVASQVIEPGVGSVATSMESATESAEQAEQVGAA